MYEIDLNLPKQIVADVLSNHEIHSVAFVGCGASMSDLYPAKYFLANNTDKLNVQIFTANEFNYDTPSWVNEHTFVITCSLGGSTPETVEANKTAKKHNCPVVSLTNKAGSALTVDADYVIVHGFHANFAAKCEKPGYAIALAVEILQQTEGYDHYEDMITGLTNVFELCENAAQSCKKLAKKFAEDFKDDKDRVMRKKDGYYTYFVPDVAYHLAKFERGFDRAINIQGSDHHGTVARVRIGLQAASKTLGISIPKTFPEYLLHKMLLVVKDGQEVKMSKRAGTYVTLRDLVDWVGRDAARFFLVSRKSDAEFVFDINLACSKSDENPVYYLQYAHARICSVLRQAQEKGFAIPAEAEAAEFDLSSLTGTAATALAAKFAGYGETLAVAARDLAPHLICVYLKELAADFHTFYNAERVLVDNEAERNARLALCMAARRVLANGLEVLGVSAPERM